MRDDKVKPLAELYNGPNFVIDRATKHFTHTFYHGLKRFSTDRLKSVYKLTEINYKKEDTKRGSQGKGRRDTRSRQKGGTTD